MRKVLSFVLVLALVLGSFSFAFGLTDIEDSANKDAIQVCNDLGIIDGYPDGTFQGDKAVNRAEFAAMITRALGVPESALAGYATTSFKDVAGYGWAVPYLAFCESKGIMLGDGMGNAMPGRTISVNEAITMALRAVGYTENSALLVGSWPANYVTLGQQQGLYTDLATATTIDRENAAQVIYNALTVDLVAVNADGKTELTVTGGQNMLEAYLDCEDAGKGFIAIGAANELFGFDDTVINVADKVGAYGQTWQNSDGDLVAFVPDGVKMVGKYNGAAGKFVSDGTKYTLGTSTYATTAAVVIGNDAVTTSMGGVFGSAVIDIYEGFGDQSEVTIWADVSGTKITKIYSVVAWQAIAGDQAASDVQEDIADGELLGEEFVLNNDDSIDTSSFKLVGVDSLEDIDEDNVVYVYTDASKIRKVMVGTDTVTGTVEEVGTDYVVFSGTEYSLAVLTNAGVTTEVTIADFEAGDEGTLYLDANGRVFEFDKTSVSTDTYAVATYYEAASGIDDGRVRLVNSDENAKTYYIDDDAEWTEGTEFTSGTATGYVLTPAGAKLTVAEAGYLVGYSLDDAGYVDGINTSSYAIGATDKVVANNNFNNARAITSDVVVFAVTGAGATLDVSVVSINDVIKGVAGLTGGGMYYTNSNGHIVAMLVHEAALKSTSTDDTLIVANSITDVVVGDGTGSKVVGFSDGVAYTGISKKGVTIAKNLAGVFDLYKVTLNGSDEITALTALNTTAATAMASGNLYGTTGTTVTVTAISSAKDRITITASGGTATTMASISSDVVVYEYDAITDTFAVAEVGDIRVGDTVQFYDVAVDDETDSVVDIILFQ